jgi:hypothetical protein
VASAVPAFADGLAVSLSDSDVTVGGAAWGATVVLMSAENRPVEFATRLDTSIRTAADDDRDGQVAFTLEQPAAPGSIWIAIDGSTGAFGFESPLETAPFAFPEPLGLAPPPDGGAPVVAADGHSTLHVVVVRPGTGAWKTIVVDGGLSENTGIADGRASLLQPEWEALAGAAESPGALGAEDIVFAMDPANLSVDVQLFGGLDELP